MPIGEFGGAPRLPTETIPAYSTGLYWFYEMGQAALNPSRALADMTRLSLKNPLNPWSNTPLGKTMAAAAEVFERSTRRYAKPEWRIDHTVIGGERIPVHINTAWQRPFCNLLHFERVLSTRPAVRSPSF